MASIGMAPTRDPKGDWDVAMGRWWAGDYPQDRSPSLAIAHKRPAKLGGQPHSSQSAPRRAIPSGSRPRADIHRARQLLGEEPEH